MVSQIRNLYLSGIYHLDLKEEVVSPSYVYLQDIEVNKNYRIGRTLKE